MGLGAVIMLDVNNDAKVGFRRIELLTGPERRRRWSAEDKARIVQESLAPGARVADVARRWQLCPQQLFAWRREARDAMAEKPVRIAGSWVCADCRRRRRRPQRRRARRRSAPVIEVKLAGAVVRVVGGQDDGAQLTAVLRAVRASASRS